MRRIVIAIGTTISALVLLFSWPTSTNHLVVGPSTGAAGAAGGVSNAASTAAAGKGVAGTYDGAVANTWYGPVQVRITVAGGKFTAVDAVQLPSGNGHDQQINSYAIPILSQEAIAAQSAKVDMVSGATYTSTGYLQSLQSALDKAGL